ncbi:MAG: hypothetical protein Q4C45_08430 [Oscillospiraceae bacterium]|nr:hypothetical protein [Oscillospiraceae bacterium]
MQRQQILGGLVLLALTAAGIAGTAWLSGAVTAMTPLEGEALSPDGRYEARQLDEGGDGEPVPSAETVRVADTATGDVLWEDSGDYETTALWSPDGRYLALSRRGRACSRVTVLETETFTGWEIPLPAEARSAEYAFLHAVEWLDGHTLRFRYRDMQADSEDAALFYRCFLRMEDGELTGGSSRETTETLSGEYDFDHDGAAETVELTTVWEPEGKNAGWYELNVRRADGSLLWSEMASLSHAGWNSLFACEIGGQDYLLRYLPTMYQGSAACRYEVFSLDAAGQERPLREGSVDFDTNFGSPIHQGFDPEEIADFLWDLRGCLADSRLLISTEDGELHADGEIPAAELPSPFCEILALDSREAMLEALRQAEAGFKWEQGIA